MKILKQLVSELKSKPITTSAEDIDMLWQLICYPPKIALRHHQEQLLNEAKRVNLTVHDQYFTQKDLSFNMFTWGSGRRKILITHGWGSKAADFTEMIVLLRDLNDIQIIAFDAPGNGTAEGWLCNLLLFVGAVRLVVLNCGEPDVLIGHSLGAMANVITLNYLKYTPKLLISITPLIRLKENFEASMSAVGASQPVQEVFLKSFEEKFKMTALSFNMTDLYQSDPALNHWLAYDQEDLIAPYSYLEEFLTKNSTIKNKNYANAGHDRIIKSPLLLKDLIETTKTALME